MTELMVDLGCSSNMVAVRAFLERLLRGKGRHTHSAFLAVHAGDLGRRSIADLNYSWRRD